MTDNIATEAGVTIETFEGKIESANGRKLGENKYKPGFSPVTSLDYSASFEKILAYDAIPSKELPDRDDILAMVNTARKANARQKAMQAAQDAAGIIKPTMEDDDELQVQSMVRGMVASGKYTPETARAMARKVLGLE